MSLTRSWRQVQYSSFGEPAFRMWQPTEIEHLLTCRLPLQRMLCYLHRCMAMVRHASYRGQCPVAAHRLSASFFMSSSIELSFCFSTNLDGAPGKSASSCMPWSSAIWLSSSFT
jgi:hypothetical protein